MNWTLGTELDFGPKSNSVQCLVKRLSCRYQLVTLDPPFNLFLTSASTHQPIPEVEGGSSWWVLLITSWIDQPDWITPSFGLCKAALSSQYRIDWGQLRQVLGRNGTVNWFWKRIYLCYCQQKLKGLTQCQRSLVSFRQRQNYFLTIFVSWPQKELLCHRKRNDTMLKRQRIHPHSSHIEIVLAWIYAFRWTKCVDFPDVQVKWDIEKSSTHQQRDFFGCLEATNYARHTC